MMGVEVDQLYTLGGMSGYASSFVAVLYVFSQLKRKRLDRDRDD